MPHRPTSRPRPLLALLLGLVLWMTPLASLWAQCAPTHERSVAAALIVASQGEAPPGSQPDSHRGHGDHAPAGGHHDAPAPADPCTAADPAPCGAPASDAGCATMPGCLVAVLADHAAVTVTTTALLSSTPAGPTHLLRSADTEPDAPPPKGR